MKKILLMIIIFVLTTNIGFSQEETIKKQSILKVDTIFIDTDTITNGIGGIQSGEFSEDIEIISYNDATYRIVSDIPGYFNNRIIEVNDTSTFIGAKAKGSGFQSGAYINICPASFYDYGNYSFYDNPITFSYTDPGGSIYDMSFGLNGLKYNNFDSTEWTDSTLVPKIYIDDAILSAGGSDAVGTSGAIQLSDGAGGFIDATNYPDKEFFYDGEEFVIGEWNTTGNNYFWYDDDNFEIYSSDYYTSSDSYYDVYGSNNSEGGSFNVEIGLNNNDETTISAELSISANQEENPYVNAVVYGMLGNSSEFILDILGIKYTSDVDNSALWTDENLITKGYADENYGGPKEQEFQLSADDNYSILLFEFSENPFNVEIKILSTRGDSTQCNMIDVLINPITGDIYTDGGKKYGSDCGLTWSIDNMLGDYILGIFTDASNLDNSSVKTYISYKNIVTTVAAPKK